MSGQAHGANDIPIEVLTSGIPTTTEHTLAMVRLDEITEWIEAHGCAHSIVDICDLHKQPRIVFTSCTALALALDGTSVPIRISTYYGQPFYQSFDAGIELIALEPLNR